MTRFFTSDLHIRHDLVARERGFVTLEGAADHNAHERELASDWDSRVRADDHIFILGDIAMNPKKGAFDFIDARPGIKHLIAGNHDAVAGFHSSALKVQREWLEHFETVHDFLQLKFSAGQTSHKVLLSHYPYKGEGAERDQEDRLSQFRLRDEGMPLLHGHTHSAELHESPYSLHVGLDAHDMKLVSERDIQKWLDTLS
jgi:calcineurin-like phosphoesterase family protein